MLVNVSHVQVDLSYIIINVLLNVLLVCMVILLIIHVKIVMKLVPLVKDLRNHNVYLVIILDS
jgi:hypothetical protein